MMTAYALPFPDSGSASFGKNGSDSKDSARTYNLQLLQAQDVLPLLDWGCLLRGWTGGACVMPNNYSMKTRPNVEW